MHVMTRIELTLFFLLRQWSHLSLGLYNSGRLACCQVGIKLMYEIGALSLSIALEDIATNMDAGLSWEDVKTNEVIGQGWPFVFANQNSVLS